MRHLAWIVATAMVMAGIGLADGWLAEAMGQAATAPTQPAAPTTQPAAPATRPAATQGTVAKWIADLSSTDGNVRIAATKAIFAMGKDAIEPLEKAGAKQLTPKAAGGATGGRIDIVYSLVDGLKQDRVEGYRTDAFLLKVEKECTVEDVAKIGNRCGFTIKARNGIQDGYCAAFPQQGAGFAGILNAILTGEPKVISVQFMYFVAHPVP